MRTRRLMGISPLSEATSLTTKEVGWKALRYGTAGLSGMAMSRLLETGWRAWRHRPSPTTSGEPRPPWTDAIGWAIASGVGLGLARLFATRTAEALWERATHEAPPVGA
jgi:hypothetical protein